MKQVTPYLMFKKGAEKAVTLYVSVFPNSKIINTTYWSKAELDAARDKVSEEELPGEVGSVKTISFEINGQRFEACNGGSPFDFSMGISLFTNCESQAEIDAHTEALLKNGGEQLDCGWVKDPYGVFWQIAPAFMADVTYGSDQDRAVRMSLALYKMKKIDYSKLKAAAGLDSSRDESSAA